MYQSGEFIWVRFGKGRQVASVICMASGRALFAYRWSGHSKTWSKRVKVHLSDVLGPLDEEEKSWKVFREAESALREQLGLTKARA